MYWRFFRHASLKLLAISKLLPRKLASLGNAKNMGISLIQTPFKLKCERKYNVSEERLDKRLSDAAQLSRREAREMIKAGRVCLDSIVQKLPDFKSGEEIAISLDGKTLMGGGFVYIMLNKPAGFVTATSDETEQTVLDLIPKKSFRRELFPVGRLDKDTTGLLILTDDGDFAHRVTHPSGGVKKLYEIYAAELFTQENVVSFALGITLRDETRCLPARLDIDADDACHAFVEISEGKYHQVKRMVASCGNAVKSLRRLAVGGLRLDENLAEGEFRRLDKKEIERVFII